MTSGLTVKGLVVTVLTNEKTRDKLPKLRRDQQVWRGERVRQVRDQAIQETKAGSWTGSEIEAQVERIIGSPQFRNTPVLQLFLRFIVGQTVTGGVESLTERSIASAVFSRPSTFDSSIDTIVRTQAYRLRSRLREYYNSGGQTDPILIEVPKGHYKPQFSPNPIVQKELFIESVDVLPPSPEVCDAGQTHRTVALRIGLAALLSVLVFGLGLLAGKKLTQNSGSATGQKSRNSVDVFWANFAGADPQPIIAYTNAVYLATEEGTLLRFQGGLESDRGALMNPAVARQTEPNRSFLKNDERTYFENDLTGIGEVAGVAAVAQALERIGAHPVFKRSQQVSTSDLINHNTVFLGSSFVHLILNDLPKPQNFLFVLPKSGPLLWKARIDNSHPQAGEASSYSIERTPETAAIRTEYAVASLLPGLRADRKIMILAGLTTSGTQAAAQFTTSPEGVEEIKRRQAHRVSSKAANESNGFENLLRIRLNQGIDIVSTDCLVSR